MGFLAGRMTCERFRIEGQTIHQFDAGHIETLERFAISQIDSASEDGTLVGFLAGGHLFDQDFRLEKNVINETLHCAVRIDTNKVPAALRKAWLQMELAALTADSPRGRPTKAQRKQAQEAVDARCEEEVKSGRFRRMQQFPVLWDARDEVLYFGGSSPAAGEHCAALLTQAFDVSLERITPGKLAENWATKPQLRTALHDAAPSAFHGQSSGAGIAWLANQSGNFDFLGNEFLLWLWWSLETESDTITLPDETDVTAMLARTLSLECPHGETGKETITAEAPVRLPEAHQAIRWGKLPRKSGLILNRCGEQYEFTLQAETFSIGGAKIVMEGGGRGRGILEDRIESIRHLSETLDLLFAAFCERRIGKQWTAELEQIRRWLQAEPATSKKPAA